MTNNDILRRIRYAFEFSDSQMIELFAAADFEVSRARVSNWLKRDDDPAYEALLDVELALFLNGLINNRRGRRDGEQPLPERRLNNNSIFRKLKIALNLKDEDILMMLEMVNFRISKHELSAFFRNPGQKQYRDCNDQILRNFLQAMQLKYRTV